MKSVLLIPVILCLGCFQVQEHPTIKKIEIFQVDFFTTFIGNIPCEKFLDYASDHIITRNLQEVQEIDDFLSVTSGVLESKEENTLDVRAKVLITYQNGAIDEYCIDMFYATKNGKPVVIPPKMREYLMEMSK